MTSEQLDRMVDGYLECAAWADKPEGSSARFPASEKAKARKACQAFVDACGPLVDQALRQPGYSAERFGHDFWLTRCGHGTGYWDRDELKVDTAFNVTFPDRDKRTQATGPGVELGDSLSAVCYGTSDYISPFAYAGVDAYRGWLYIH